MHSLVMDGVRRTVVASRPLALPQAKPAPKLRAKRPLQQTFVGMDGIRRTAPTPRQVLANFQAEAPMAAMTPAAGVIAPSRPWSWQRPAIAFGLVAGALIASGATAVAASHLASTATNAAMTRPTRPAAAAPAASVAPRSAGLQQLLNDFVAAQGNNFGIVVKDLKTGDTASTNAGQAMESASLYKLFVAKTVLQQVDNGKLSYGQAAGGGSGLNVADCMTIMINISDNTCGRALGTIIGWGDQNASLNHEGYSGTNLAGDYPQTSPQDVATMLQRLYDGTLLSPNSSQRLLDLLKDQRINDRLPVGLPSGTVIAHKTGDLDGYMHDAGIVYGPKTDYLVVVLGHPGVNPGQFADLSGKLWAYFQQ